MKTIGLIGGMSWESTAVYYRLINEAVRRQLGGLHSAEIALRSLDFTRVVALQKAGRWDEAGNCSARPVPALPMQALPACSSAPTPCIWSRSPSPGSPACR